MLAIGIAAAAQERSAYFGDTHIHTAYSHDAFSSNVRTKPDDAYRFAKPGATTGPSRGASSGRV